MAAAAMLAISTSSIPALSSIFNKAPGEDAVSSSLHQSRDIQDVVDTGPSDLQGRECDGGSPRSYQPATVKKPASEIIQVFVIRIKTSNPWSTRLTYLLQSLQYTGSMSERMIKPLAATFQKIRERPLMSACWRAGRIIPMITTLRPLIT